MTDSTAQAAGPQERVTEADLAWLARMLRLVEGAQNALGSVAAQRASAEALSIRRILAALSSSRATQPEPFGWHITCAGGAAEHFTRDIRTAEVFRSAGSLAYTVTPLYDAVSTPQADGRPTYEELVDELRRFRNAPGVAALLSRIPKAEP